MASFYLSQVLDKMRSADADFRYMALNDLLVELDKDRFKLEKKSEEELIPLLLKRLQDISNNVQELAVKCLGPLVTKLKEDSSVKRLIDELSTSILDPKNEDLRDISAIGLKTILTQTPASAGGRRQLIAACLTHKLLEGINTVDVPEVKTHCLDVLQELIAQFGPILEKDYQKILQAVLSQLTSTRAATRKHFLALSIPDDLFAELVRHVLSNIKAATRPDQIRSLIQAVTAISQAAGHRLGKYVTTIIPEVLRFVEKSDGDDELKEACFQAFETLVIRCPSDSAAFVENVSSLSLKYIKHDPNYDAGDDDGDEEADEEDEEWSGEDEDYSDDDDMSWKVRRASAKSLAALIQTYPLHLAEFYGSMGQPLVSRFREREENVKLEIFSTFGKLLRATGFALRQGDAQAEAALRALIPKIVAGLAGPLKAKSLKTRIAVFVLLKELVSVLAGALTQELKNLVSAINSALTDKSSSSALKIEVLVFLRVAFTTHSGSAIQAHVKGLLPSICGSASDSYYRISAEGLQVLARLIPLLRPLTEKTPSFDFKPYVGPIYKATLGQLQQADIDQEVKEAAVICMALVLSHFGDNLEAVPATLQILVDRMRNEITRIPAVRGMELIAASQLNIDLSSVLPAVLTELASYLRKANRTLRQASLQALDTIVGIHGAKAQSQLEEIVKALPDLIDDSDLHLSHLALRVTVAILTLAPELSPQIAELILPEAENLLRSSLLQGLALESLLAFFGAILQGKKNKAGVTYDALLQRIVAIQPSDLRRSSSGTTLMPRQVLSSVAQVVAAITKKAADKQRDATIASFMKTVGKHEDDQEVVLALLSLGEIGRRVDLAATPQIHETILAGFDAPSEDVKQSASFALGNLAVGNMSAFLPRILEEVQKNPKHQYLVLHSLREVITRQSSRKSGKKVLLEHIQPILTLLMNNMTGEEEGTRNVVAECLGKLVLASPDTILPALHSSINNESANGRATVVTSVKFAITEQPQKSDEPLRELFGQFIALIKDSNVNVRKQTLLTLNFAAHHKPDLVKPILPTYLPAIYNEAKINPALIREVDLGPFKHKVDDGLEVRKAAYQCLYTVLEHLVDMKAFVGQLVHGLSDHADIKLLCQLMLVKLSRYASSALLEGLNDIVDPLRGTITLKLKEGAVSSDVERNEEIVRSALRAVAAISRMPNVEQALKFEDLVKTCSEGEIGQKYKQALTETDEELLK